MDFAYAAVVADFRFVFIAASDARLMERAADDPAEWIFEHSATEKVLVRDVVARTNEVPRHAMLNVQVTCSGTALTDDLFDHARALAETTLILISGASRAPTGDLDFFVAYETTPNAEGHSFLQWLAAAEVPAPRTPVSASLMGELWDAINTAASSDPPLAERVVLSMSWYRRALRETEPLFRFTNLWLALEAINPRLADDFDVPSDERQGLSGLRRHMEETSTNGRALFRASVKARNDLLHVNRVLPADVRQRIAPLIAPLDDALIAALRKLLLKPTSAAAFPASSVWPYPNRYIVRAKLQPDEEGWSKDRHPWFDQELNLKLREPAEAGKVTYDQSPTWTLNNAKQGTDLSYEFRGAETPHPPQTHAENDDDEGTDSG